MKKLIFFLSLFLFIPFHNSFSLFQPVRGLESGYIKRVIISPFDPEVIFVASKNSLYRSREGSYDFKKIAVFKDEEVEHIFFDSSLSDILYIVTSRHFYKFTNELEALFFSPDGEVIFGAAKHKGVFYLGTSKGLYSASEDALIWRKIKALSGFSVYSPEPDEEGLYLATERGAYFLKNNKKAERLFVMRKEEAIGEEGLAAQLIKIDIFDKGRLWLGTNHGLFVSEDRGINWRKLYIPGIDNLFINSLVQTKLQDNTVYLGTTKGFFMVDFKRNTSQQLFEGLHSSYICWAEFTPKGKIYLATSKGLFENDYFTSIYPQDSMEITLEEEPFVEEIQEVILSYKKIDFRDSLEMVLEKEPLVGEIQEAALLYNEVDPDKIKNWRKSLKYRALFPEVSVDYDKTIWGNHGGSYYVGPYDWGVNLKWDLADLIWNPSQTSIDTRSKLNTQLRLDILDEINRVYFERLRLKKEFSVAEMPEDELFKKKLRLAELTAIIDGYTGGYLSKQIKERNAKQ